MAPFEWPEKGLSNLAGALGYQPECYWLPKKLLIRLYIAGCRFVCEITFTYGYVSVARSSLTDRFEVVGTFTAFFFCGC